MLQAQDEPAATPPPADSAAAQETTGDEAAPAAEGSPKEVWQKTFAEWKALLTSIREVQLKYRAAASEEEKQELSGQFVKLLDQGEILGPKVLAMAEAYYASAPNENQNVTAFLANALQSHVMRDQYEDAARVAQMLLDNGNDEPIIHKWAGMAAYSLENFDEAQKHLDIAKEANLLDRNDLPFYESLEAYKEAWKRESKLRMAEQQADDLPRVLLKTNRGDVTIELFENEAPNSVANFISLVKKGFYNDLDFHRVLGNFMAQGGDPKGDGTGGPGYQIPCECFEEDHRWHFRGSLSMAHAGRDTGGSQFFLTFRPTPHLNGRHTVFGRVIDGFDVLDKLQRRDPSQPNQPEADKILEATVIRDRGHEYKPETLPEN
jgi:cyclophilin family peptidyl-prolyl cis-trans isomerase